jgi:tRNA modification GTPase
MTNNDTIAAIITAPGEAAISAIRISGDKSWKIIKELTGKDFTEKQVDLAWINKEQEKIDQVIVIPFKKPKSFTGEDVIEIHSHGGFLCVNKILELVLEKGARLAKPGEFSEQAVLNGKMDLIKAEAINDLITAKTDLARKNALQIYKGELGNEIEKLRDNLLNLLGAITASIDFPDEVGDFDREEFKTRLNACISNIEEILKTEKQGEILRQGYKVALIGKPNAGKSTLLNTLLKKDRAIVTDIEGTTRDSIEEFYNLDGFPIVLVDTAGIRESDDTIEKIGIEKSFSIAKDADLILELIDLSQTDTKVQIKESVKIGTKADLNKANGLETALNISALKDSNISELKTLIKEKINLIAGSEASVTINQRQADLLRKSKDALVHSLNSSELSEDFWTIDLRNAIQALGEITGESLTEELLDNIFSRFCIGK